MSRKTQTQADDAAPQDAAVAQAPDAAPAPEPVSKGTFALFPVKDGGLHLVYRLDGDTEDGHQEIPGWAVAMLRKVAAGENPGIPGFALKAFQKVARSHG